MTILGWIIASIMAIAIIGLPAWGLLKLIDLQKEKYEDALERIWSEFEVSETPEKGLVEITFHTYRGIIAFTEQREHKIYVTRRRAEPLLRKLHKVNLKYGIYGHGALYVPFVSYFSMKKQIAKVKEAQER